MAKEQECPPWPWSWGSPTGWKHSVRGEGVLPPKLVSFGFLLGAPRAEEEQKLRKVYSVQTRKRTTYRTEATLGWPFLGLSPLFFPVCAPLSTTSLLNASALGDFPPIGWNSCTRPPLLVPLAWLPCQSEEARLQGHEAPILAACVQFEPGSWLPLHKSGRVCALK